jgi:hypothetical protein
MAFLVRTDQALDLEVGKVVPDRDGIDADGFG